MRFHSCFLVFAVVCLSLDHRVEGYDGEDGDVGFDDEYEFRLLDEVDNTGGNLTDIISITVGGNETEFELPAAVSASNVVYVARNIVRPAYLRGGQRRLE